MISRKEILEKAVHDCYVEMYQLAQPSANWDELVEKYSTDKETATNDPFYMHYYLSMDDYTKIIESYMKAYHIDGVWEDYVDIVKNYLIKGGSKDIYVDPKDGFPGYRDYENVYPLKDVIGEENADLCLDHIESCKNYYKFEREELQFRMAVMNYSPSSNKEMVIDYWKIQGVDIDIKDNILNIEEDEE